jgi:hypothetical protein
MGGRVLVREDRAAAGGGGCFARGAVGLSSLVVLAPGVQAQQNTKLETLKRIHDSLVASRPGSFEDCVAWARLRFEELFNNLIRQLLHNFPVDQVGAETPKGQLSPLSAPIV